MEHSMLTPMVIIALYPKHIQVGEERIQFMLVTHTTWVSKEINTLIIRFVWFYNVVKHWNRTACVQKGLVFGYSFERSKVICLKSSLALKVLYDSQCKMNGLHYYYNFVYIIIDTRITSNQSFACFELNSIDHTCINSNIKSKSNEQAHLILVLTPVLNLWKCVVRHIGAFVACIHKVSRWRHS